MNWSFSPINTVKKEILWKYGFVIVQILSINGNKLRHLSFLLTEYHLLFIFELSSNAKILFSNLFWEWQFNNHLIVWHLGSQWNRNYWYFSFINRLKNILKNNNAVFFLVVVWKIFFLILVQSHPLPLFTNTSLLYTAHISENNKNGKYSES